MRKPALICLLLLLAIPVYGQDATSNWYFGQQGGIRFNPDGSVTALEDGRIQTFEGCASISDPSGNLLFYTDGITVYDREHDIMVEGRGLYGDISSAQSAIIVPDPADPQLFYIFTVDTKVFPDDPDFGLNYSIVDMSLNAGRGAVIEKNVNLLGDCSEKITAVIKDCEDRSIWVVTLATADGSPGLLDTYHAFEVTSSGVVRTSVQSTFTGLDAQDPRGYLKISPDGTRLANANATAGLFLYDFDSSTGMLSNQTKIEINGVNKTSYGVEFSPDSQLLYVHASNDQQGESGHASTLYQYDLNAADISATEVVLHDGNDFRGALQLGSNGRIYRTIAQSYTVGTSFLGVINNPNVRGTGANYKHQAVSLGSGRATQGFPPFVQSFFNKTALIRNADGTTSNSLELCENGGFLLQTDDIPGATYEWTKDGTPIANVANTFQINSATTEDSGRYAVRITTPDPKECPIIGEAIITVNPNPVALDLGITQCDIDPGASEDGIGFFNLTSLMTDPNLEYRFYETASDRDSDIPIEDIDRYRNNSPFNQTIFYALINEFGCLSSAELELEVRSNPFATTSDHQLYSCDLDPLDGLLSAQFDLGSFAAAQYPDVHVSYFANEEDASLEINPLPPVYTSNDRVIFARLELDNECQGIDRIQLEVLPSPVVEFEPEYILCTDGDPIILEAPAGFDSYRWEALNGNQSVLSEQRQVSISELGQYRLVAGLTYDFPQQSITCEQSAQFTVIPSNRAQIEQVEIEDFSSSNSVVVNVSGAGSYEFSLDGVLYQDQNVFEGVPAGFYTVYTRDKNGCGISTEEISVLGYPKFFTPNGDGINDVWRITGTNEQFQPDAFIAIYDRYGKLLAQISPLDHGWNGTFQAKPLPATDYWFRVSLSDGREVTGHFALKR